MGPLVIILSCMIKDVFLTIAEDVHGSHSAGNLSPNKSFSGMDKEGSDLTEVPSSHKVLALSYTQSLSLKVRL